LTLASDSPEAPTFSARAANPPRESEPGMGESQPQSRLIPANVRPNGVVTEHQLAQLVTRVGQQISPATANPVTVSQPNAPVSRIRVLAALVKLVAAPGEIAAYRDMREFPTTPDDAQTPPWGQPYVAEAIEQRWWNAEQPLYARDKATW